MIKLKQNTPVVVKHKDMIEGKCYIRCIESSTEIKHGSNMLYTCIQSCYQYISFNINDGKWNFDLLERDLEKMSFYQVDILETELMVRFT